MTATSTPSYTKIPKGETPGKRKGRPRGTSRDKCYYVYELSDPRDGDVFYVGKGKGERLHAHARMALKGEVDNPEKFAKCRDIILSGFRVKTTKVIEGLTEADALRLERERIASYPKGQLTNISPGCTAEPERVRVKAAYLISRSKSFCVWAHEQPRTREHVAVFWLIERALRWNSIDGTRPCPGGMPTTPEDDETHRYRWHINKTQRLKECVLGLYGLLGLPGGLRKIMEDEAEAGFIADLLDWPILQVRERLLTMFPSLQAGGNHACP